MRSESKKTPETAVWYFIAATFAFALGPAALDMQAVAWSDWLWRGLGIVLFMLGVVVAIRERRLSRQARDSIEQVT